MGASAKRKKEKAADFQKPKLKVGKTKPRASNATDTSFRAKAIVVGQQSLTTAAPSATSQFAHSLSLLTSKSDTQRREALASLTNSLSSAAAQDLHQPAVTIILKARPLLIDSSRTVRAGALSLLRALPDTDIDAHAADIVIYAHIGLTHMSADIRTSSLDVLDFLLCTAGLATVCSPGGWTGSLRRLTGLLNWHSTAATDSDKVKGWTAAARTKLDDAKARARQIALLALLLDTGLSTDDEKDSRGRRCCFPLWDVEAHALPARPDPYGYLGLFKEQTTGIAKDGDDKSSDSLVLSDPEGRAQAFRARFEQGIRRGLAEAKKEGGEVGRAAKSVETALAPLHGHEDS